MSSTSDYPENVPSAKKGEAVSVAAFGLVGAEGTLSPEYLRACSDFCDFCDSLIEMNFRAIKERRPFDDPNRFLGAIELMQTFVRFQEQCA